MKVVLFCGGLGLRLRDYADNIPKPMVPIGYRPILWHVMKYYAHFGHRDFVLCLGYRGDTIKNYFINYNECLTNDFVLAEGGKNLTLYNSDIHDWKITFAETGVDSNVGQRLQAVQKYLEGEDVFLANYCDGLTNLPMPALLTHARERDTIATLVSVRPSLTYHVIETSGGNLVSEIKEMTRSDIRINGGYFVFKKEIFDYIRAGEELVLEPFRRLIRERQLSAYEYDGFYASMDTFKDKQQLDEMHDRAIAPWEVWRQEPHRPGATRSNSPGDKHVTAKIPLSDRHA
jgi:glucose-1-phosphate cytidylyltransferase